MKGNVFNTLGLAILIVLFAFSLFTADETPAQTQISLTVSNSVNEMPAPGKLYTFNISATNLGSNGEIEAKLSSVTRWRGECGNKPRSSNPSTDFDLKFDSDDNRGWNVVGTDGQTLTKTGNSTITATLKVQCYDYAAFGILTVTAKRKSDNTSTSLSRRVPRDNNGNKISDAWPHDRAYANFDAATAADAETGPNGNGNPGDGFNAFEEYRGFWVYKDDGTIGHQRMNPTKKNVCIVSQFTQGYGYAKNLPHPFKPWRVHRDYVLDAFRSDHEGCG